MRNQVNREDITQPECGQASVYSPSPWPASAHPSGLGRWKPLKSIKPRWGEWEQPSWMESAWWSPTWQSQTVLGCVLPRVPRHVHTCTRTHITRIQEHTTISMERNNFISRQRWRSEIAIIHATAASPRKSGAISCHWQERQRFALLPWCL